MKVPLIAKVINDGISIVTNGHREVVPFPYRPYVWAREITATTHTDKEGPFSKIDLWKKEWVNLYKLYFDNPETAYRFYKDNQESQNVSAEYYSQQMMIEKEDFFLDYPNDEELKILIFDIEVKTDGSGIFPKPNTSPIIAIGYKKTGDDSVTVLDDYNTVEEDRNIVDEFLDMVKEYDPDVIVGFNCIWFDIPYVIGRAQELGLEDIKGVPKITYLTRYGVLPFGKTMGEDNRPTIELHGRVVFDILPPVNKDQTLFGIKDHKMKTLAEWYKIPYIDVEMDNNQHMIGTDELKEYLINDVDVTEALMKIYFPLYIDLAEMMKVPLESVVNGSPSFIPKLVMARDLFKYEMVPLQSNSERYRNPKFQAAIVDILKTGFFPRVRKVDFASLYPNIIRTFNLGPDTTQLCTMMPYTGEYRIKRVGDKLWINIPDSNFRKNILIKVDMTRDSFLKKSMDELFDMRIEAKEKIKLNGPDKDFWKTRSSAIKVLMNSIFGYNGLQYSTWGDMGTAIAIVSLARWMIEKLKVDLEGNIIEIDTDGLYIDNDADADELNEELARYINEYTGIPKEDITIELEKEFDGPGYFYKQKNYVLLKEDGKIEKHGVSIKSSRSPGIHDKVVDAMADAILHQKPEKNITMLMTGLRDITTYDTKDFIMRSNINKPLNEYKNPNCLQCKLADMAKEAFNRDIRVGDQLTYVKTFDGYKLSSAIKGFHELDKRYYGEIIEKAFYIFNKGSLKEKEIRKAAVAEALASQMVMDLGLEEE